MSSGSRGLTTGACAAGAARAATLAAVSGAVPISVEVDLPGGSTRRIPVRVLAGRVAEDNVRAEVMKDAGEDPDVTHGAVIRATVRLFEAVDAEQKRDQTSNRSELAMVTEWPDGIDAKRIALYGGMGVGVATKKGLPVKPGEPAINPVPRRMIAEAVLRELPDDMAAEVIIEVPFGSRIAKKTMNARLGIIRGISILGTNGVIEPMSDSAIRATIDSQISVAVAEGARDLLFTPGRRGEKWAMDTLGLDELRMVQVSNEWGHALKAAKDAGARELLLAGHPSKLSKLAGGSATSHSRDVDVPFEMLASLVEKSGFDEDVVKMVCEANTVEEFLPVLSVRPDCAEMFFNLLGSAIVDGARVFCGDTVRVGVAMYNRDSEVLWVGDAKGAATGFGGNAG